MNAIRPIHAELLKDSFTLIVPDGNGFEEYSVRSVRAESTGSISERYSARMTDTSRLTIYYDCANSLPRALEFCAGMRLEYSGELYEILEAKLFCGVSPHHWKLTAAKIEEKEG